MGSSLKGLPCPPPGQRGNVRISTTTTTKNKQKKKKKKKKKKTRKKKKKKKKILGAPNPKTAFILRRNMQKLDRVRNYNAY
jgi:hypothetical protein